ncbi:MAG: hypothetical protein R2730_05805 [Chitinophagales bacterium]
MSSKNCIRVFEYDKLRYTDNNVFEKHHLDAIIQFNERNKNQYFTPIYNGIQFGSYVGVIQIGGLTIEILPKADKDSSYSKKQKDLWQGILLDMLRVCKFIKVDKVSETKLNKRHNSILDIYLEMFLNEVELLINRGLIKKYRRVQSNQKSLKGKLVFAQNISKNLIHKERFYCEHQVYDINHLLHDILFKALIISDKLIKYTLKDKLKRILFEFSDYKETNITTSHFAKVNLNRNSMPYNRAIEIAKMIILNYSPNLNSGKDNMLTLLFDMNKLWEEYIYRILTKFKGEGWKVNFQNSKQFWNTKTIKPDIFITSPTKENFIIDTKWKIVDASCPSDDDLKQMFSYNLRWESERSMLLYPKVNQVDSKFGSYHYKDALKESNKCKLGFVSVIEEGVKRKDEDIAKEVFRKLTTNNGSKQTAKSF